MFVRDFQVLVCVDTGMYVVSYDFNSNADSVKKFVDGSMAVI